MGAGKLSLVAALSEGLDQPPASYQRPRLILDAGGVLFAEEFRPFLGSLAEQAGREPQSLIDFYNRELRGRLWRGGISEEGFWAAIASELGIEPESALWRDKVSNASSALPAQAALARWAERAELWILSNHRHEWLHPMLAECHIEHLFERVIVSSEIGLMKPDAGAYSQLLEGEPPRALFVDDKQENLEAAEALGIETLLADPEHRWFAAVDAWLVG